MLDAETVKTVAKKVAPKSEETNLWGVKCEHCRLECEYVLASCPCPNCKSQIQETLASAGHFSDAAPHAPLTLAIMSMNAKVMRDIKARKGVAANEIIRRAYLYVARNQLLPPQVRHQAQLQLNTFGKYTRPTTVKARCTESGRGSGVITEFGLCRYQFRLKARNGDLNGVQKASW